MPATLTKLVVQLSPIPPDFRGTPQQFAEAIVARIKIAAPFGITTFVTGSNMPTSNQGPWLKNGVEWYVWSDDEATYIPLIVDASVDAPYFIQDGEPRTDTDTLLWFQTRGNGTADAKVENIHVLLNQQWVPVLFSRGNTANRPTNVPEFFKYYDDDIQTMIWWERGDWRTISGVKGDLKFVSARTRADALAQNPGWEIFGTGDSDNEAVRGRMLVPALKDHDGLNPIAASSGITQRNQGAMSGAETHTLADSEVPATPVNTVKESTGVVLGDNSVWQNSNDGDNSANVDAGGASLVSDVILKVAGGGQAHNNVPPVFAAFLLRKK